MPIERNRVTAIGYHSVDDGRWRSTRSAAAATRDCCGACSSVFGASQSSLVWYQLAGNETSAVDVGAAPGTDVYAPVDGTIAGITNYVLNGRTRGVRLDIRPLTAGALIVSVTRLRPDPARTVGESVAAGSTRLGMVLDLSHVERQALARFTQDAGNHVTLQAYSAASRNVP